MGDENQATARNLTVVGFEVILRKLLNVTFSTISFFYEKCPKKAKQLN